MKVASAICHWQLGIGHLGIRTQCNIALLELSNAQLLMPKATFIELGIYVCTLAFT